MTPPTHIALGYILCRFRKRPVTFIDMATIAFFSILPDIADKSLHYGFGLFESGRTVFHNLFMLVLMLLVACSTKRAWIAFASIGIASHIVSDFVSSFLRSFHLDFSDIPDWWTYLLFPIRDPVLNREWSIVYTDYLLEGPILVLSLAYWYRDGMPGIPKRKLSRDNNRN